ncbi:bromodomain and WD repeat-containing protein 3-like isoform X2 [Oscarella lobularis]|uniref:bromodomain and WD repeat-containing protein 3-like isoform X2 n=1 Tax=Oscarella lobularis TaxID=121494 RepID=UPI0033133C41
MERENTESTAAAPRSRTASDNRKASMEKDLYFLIAKYLSTGPCTEAAKALNRELTTHGSSDFRHIGADHLFRIVEREALLVDKVVTSSVDGLSSFLGAGRQSLLRKKQDMNPKAVGSSLECAVSKRIPFFGRQVLNRGHVLAGQKWSGSANRRNIMTEDFYKEIVLHRKILGHLAPVYCLLMDRTGRRIFTGADDNLVKIWSSTDGRLLMTLRGHQSVIADISVNHENTLLASGGLDKTVRVWDLKNGSPVAVLHGHTGGITSVEFCPTPIDEAKCLISTGKDGALCIWHWDSLTNEFGEEPQKFVEKRKPSDQLLCSAFSPGGSFLVTGGTDHVVRIYRVNPPPSQQIAELEGHTENVLSAVFSHHGDRFLTGSHDGTARVWQFRAGRWESDVLSLYQRKDKDDDDLGNIKAVKLKVTVISWTVNDRFVVTAGNDAFVRVWDAGNYDLLHLLKGHTKDVYVLECHPFDERILLSAGIDGHIIVWNILTGEKLKLFDNACDSESGANLPDLAPLHEGKSSADGLSFVFTDCQGYLSIFGFGSSADYLKVPDHQFFHTDYRPLIRDANGYVLDEQTQVAPHLMPPPYLVNADGNPYPPVYQRLICGWKETAEKKKTSDSETKATSAEEEEGRTRLDAAIARLERERQATLEPRPSLDPPNLRPPFVPVPPAAAVGHLSVTQSYFQQPNVALPVASSMSLWTTSMPGSGMVPPAPLTWPSSFARPPIFTNPWLNSSGGSYPNAAATFANGVMGFHHAPPLLPVSTAFNPTSIAAAAAASASFPIPSSRAFGLPPQPFAQSAAAPAPRSNDDVVDVESVDVSAENRMRVAAAPAAAADDSGDNDEDSGDRAALSGSVASFIGLDPKEAQMRWRSRTIVPPLPAPAANLSEERRRYLADEELRRFADEQRKTPPPLQLDQPSTAAERNVESPRTVRRRRRNALQQQLAEAAATALQHRRRTLSLEDDDLNAMARMSSSSEDEWQMSSDSSEYSDWTADVGFNIRRRNRRVIPPSRVRRSNGANQSGQEDSDQEDGEAVELPEGNDYDYDERGNGNHSDTGAGPSRGGERRAAPPPPKPKVSKPKKPKINYEAFWPSPWLRQKRPALSPFFPQLGDKVVYCWQGHEDYVNAVRLSKAYEIRMKHFPWHSHSFKPQEVCQVLSMHFVAGPPTLCSIKLGLLSPGPLGFVVGRSFSLRYHDMPDVPDFLIPYNHFRKAVKRKWSLGDRFKSMIDESWWNGTVVAHEPWNPSVSNSLWQCYSVRWDTGEDQERLSPWDMEPLSEDDDAAGSASLTRRQSTSENSDSERDPIDDEDDDGDESDAWGTESIEEATERILGGLETVESLPIAQPFLDPVNLDDYPDYHVVVPYPIDIQTIKERLKNAFYRRLKSLLWDVKHLHKNANAYNEEESQIVHSSEALTRLLCKYVSDSSCRDILALYNSRIDENDDENDDVKDPDVDVSGDESGDSTDTIVDGEDVDDGAFPTPAVPPPPPKSDERKCKRPRIMSEESVDSLLLNNDRGEKGGDNDTRDDSTAKIWIPLAQAFLDEMLQLDMSEPFRQPVDLIEYPDYPQYVTRPVDFSTIKERLLNGIYGSPDQFCSDVRLVFTNSRLYNTDANSQIALMTAKLSMYFESRTIGFLQKCKDLIGDVKWPMREVGNSQTWKQLEEELLQEEQKERNGSGAGNPTATATSHSRSFERSRPRIDSSSGALTSDISSAGSAAEETSSSSMSSEEEEDDDDDAASSDCSFENDEYDEYEDDESDSDDEYGRRRRSRARPRCIRRKKVVVPAKRRRPSSKKKSKSSAVKRGKAKKSQNGRKRSRHTPATAKSRRSSASSTWGELERYGRSRPARQAAEKARSNVALMEEMLDEVDAEPTSLRPSQRRNKATVTTTRRSRPLAGYRDDFSSDEGYLPDESFEDGLAVTRRGRLVKPSSRVLRYSGD